MPTSIDITFTHYNRPPTEHLHFRVLTCVFQVHLLWRTNECADIRIFSSQLLPARISIFDQNQEAEIFKFRWCRQSEFKNQLNLTSKILTRMLHITNINSILYSNKITYRISKVRVTNHKSLLKSPAAALQLAATTRFAVCPSHLTDHRRIEIHRMHRDRLQLTYMLRRG